MNTRKYKQVAKEASEAFSITSGIVSFLVSTLGSFFRFPAFVSWITGLGTGLIVACFTGADAWETEVRKEQEEQQARSSRMTTSTMITAMQMNVGQENARNDSEFSTAEQNRVVKLASNDDKFNVRNQDEPASEVEVTRLKR